MGSVSSRSGACFFFLSASKIPVLSEHLQLSKAVGEADAAPNKNTDLEVPVEILSMPFYSPDFSLQVRREPIFTV